FGFTSVNGLDVRLHELLIMRCSNFEIVKRGYIDRAEWRAGPSEFIRYRWRNNDGSNSCSNNVICAREWNARIGDVSLTTIAIRFGQRSITLLLISSSCRKYSSSMRYTSISRDINSDSNSFRVIPARRAAWLRCSLPASKSRHEISINASLSVKPACFSVSSGIMTGTVAPPPLRV